MKSLVNEFHYIFLLYSYIVLAILWTTLHTTQAARAIISKQFIAFINQDPGATTILHNN
jgi:hypothetical protein